ncbi:MAG: hypothetical protein HQL91_13190 [Magnetococcales bacterium]|nr:hypothetical protein [Magnetococcales bacterium]
MEKARWFHDWLVVWQWKRGALFGLMLVWMALMGGDGGEALAAGAPSSAPLLRVETGMHLGMIRRIAMAADEHHILSVGDDKTLRIWSGADGHLQSTLRVPLGQLPNEGALFALAYSPDGRTVAMAGQTGVEWDGAFCIYLIDLQGGVLRRRITGLPEAVTHLAFSPNGAYLAAVFGEKAGLQVFSIPSGARVYASDAYQVPAYWVDFAADGRLVTSSYDGMVRMYDANFRPRIARQLAKGGQPHGVAFSPDGSRVAVGFKDRPTVAVLSAEDLTLSYLPDVSGVSDHLWVVAWSRDGRTLYAGGGHADRGRNLMRWWNQSGESDARGRGDYVDVTASRGTVMQILPLKAGGVVFAAADPALGALDGQGFALFLRDRTIGQFQGTARRLLVSEKGDAVEFDMDASGQNRVRFSVSKLLLKPPTMAGMHEPRLQSAAIRVTGWWGGETLQGNGTAIPLPEKENPIALALDPKDRFFVLGTSQHVRLYTHNNALRWKTVTPAPVWAVNISGNGHWVVAALGDGTIRWFEVMDGDEGMALFVHRDQKRWAVWTPGKIFTLSSGAEGLLGWHVNRGLDQLAEFHPISQGQQSKVQEYFKKTFQ